MKPMKSVRFLTLVLALLILGMASPCSGYEFSPIPAGTFEIVISCEGGSVTHSFDGVDHIIVRRVGAQDLLVAPVDDDAEEGFVYPVPGNGVWAIGMPEISPQ